MVQSARAPLFKTPKILQITDVAEFLEERNAFGRCLGVWVCGCTSTLGPV